jgi:hypothetical protein
MRDIRPYTRMANCCIGYDECVDATTVADLVRWYIEIFQTIWRWQRTKQAHLESLERYALGKLDAYDLTAAILLPGKRSASVCHHRRTDAARGVLLHISINQSVPSPHCSPPKREGRTACAVRP